MPRRRDLQTSAGRVVVSPPHERASRPTAPPGEPLDVRLGSCLWWRSRWQMEWPRNDDPRAVLGRTAATRPHRDTGGGKRAAQRVQVAAELGCNLDEEPAAEVALCGGAEIDCCETLASHLDVVVAQVWMTVLCPSGTSWPGRWCGHPLRTPRPAARSRPDQAGFAPPTAAVREPKVWGSAAWSGPLEGRHLRVAHEGLYQAPGHPLSTAVAERERRRPTCVAESSTGLRPGSSRCRRSRRCHGRAVARGAPERGQPGCGGGSEFSTDAGIPARRAWRTAWRRSGSACSYACVTRRANPPADPGGGGAHAGVSAWPSVCSIDAPPQQPHLKLQVTNPRHPRLRTSFWLSA